MRMRSETEEDGEGGINRIEEQVFVFVPFPVRFLLNAFNLIPK